MRKWTNRLKISCQVLPIIAVILSYLSCTSKEKETSNIPIFSKDNADTVHMSSLIKNWHHVMLETKQESLMGSVGDISIDDSLLFIEATKPMGEISILVFNKEGKFIREIGCKGRARNEYVRIACWAVDKWNKEVLIGDSFKNKLMRYAYDGSFLGDIPCHDILLRVEDMNVISKTHLSFTRDIPTENMDNLMEEHKEQVKRELDKVLKSQSRFLITDRELNLVSRLSDRGIFSSDYSYGVSSSIFVNKIIYARDPVLNDTLYRWENNKFIPKCLIYIDDCKASDIDIYSERIGELQKKKSNEYRMFKYEQMVNNRYFFTEGNNEQYLIDLKNNSIHTLKFDKLENLSSPNSCYRLFTHKNYLIASKDATAILELKEQQEESNIEVSSKEQELYDSIEEDGNPVIFFYELKN